jgi:maltose alpha-D-glucosyltransferase/alpha-amylase
MAFHFPVMPRMFMAIRMEDRYPIIDILDQTPPIPENCQWAMFLRNHDELTLEMVTDEERDYMYRVYAQDRQMRINLGIRRRLAPLLGNDRRRIELMNVLLFSMPGTPVIYYGDEIGMGDNIYLGDRNGVRTPMQWSADRNAGFSRSSPQKLYLPITSDPEYHYETINVEAQQNNPNSLLWWMKRLIEHRKQYKAFGRGSIEFLHPENRKVLAFYRRYGEENLLIVVNLSRFPQFVELDLSASRGLSLVEIFGRTEFPAIGDQPYLLSLGAHGYYWFSLEKRRARLETVSGDGKGTATRLPVVQIASFDHLADKRTTAALTKLLPAFLQTRRWYRGKARTLRTVDVVDTLQVTATAYMALVQVEYTDGDPDMYVLPVAIATGEAAGTIRSEHSDTVVACLRGADGTEGVLYGAVWSREFQDALLDLIGRRRTVRGTAGELAGAPTREFRRLAENGALDPSVSRAEQSNSSIIYGDKLILKLFRKLEPGINPDLEISLMLMEREFEHTPPISGHLEYRPSRGEPMTVAVIHSYVRNEGDAWKYTLDQLGPFYENVRARAESEKWAPTVDYHPLVLKDEAVPQTAQEVIGAYIESARLLGDRTARMHLALADPTAGPEFAPEPFTDHYRMGLYHGMVQQANRGLQLLRKRLPHLSEAAQADARLVLEREADIKARYRPLRDQRIETQRIRHHGDFHLGQVLYTGKDFIIIDFEGEPLRPLSERRLKRSPLRDVAGMLRSFQYVAWFALPLTVVRPQSWPVLESWAAYWTAWVSAAYLAGYFDTARDAGFVPKSPQHLRLLLDAFLLEKVIYEIGYELNNRPDWVRIPLRGALSLLV